MQNAPVPATSVKLERPVGLAFDTDGDLYISACYEFGLHSQIYKVDQYGLLTVFAGVSVPGFSGDGGPALAAEIYCPRGFAFDGAGNLYLADAWNHRIRRIDVNGMISAVAGGAGGGYGGDGGPAASALLNDPADVAFDAAGNLFFADQANHRIRMISAQGTITTIAGAGEKGSSGDGGLAVAATLNEPISIAFDDAGSLYIAELGGSRVRRVDPQGIITTIAGTGELGATGDGGPAAEARISRPAGLAFDSEGNLFVSTGSDGFLGDHYIRRIDRDGMITTFAGTGESGYSGDGGPALSANIRYPGSIVFDSADRMYFADGGNNRVRRVDTNGIITTVAGGAP